MPTWGCLFWRHLFCGCLEGKPKGSARVPSKDETRWVCLLLRVHLLVGFKEKLTGNQPTVLEGPPTKTHPFYGFSKSPLKKIMMFALASRVVCKRTSLSFSTKMVQPKKKNDYSSKRNSGRGFNQNKPGPPHVPNPQIPPRERASPGQAWPSSEEPKPPRDGGGAKIGTLPAIGTRCRVPSKG